MSVSAWIIYSVLLGLSYVVAPVMLIWGWVRWARQPKDRTPTSILSLIGFGLATTSALLAVSTVAYAFLIRSFPYYDPALLRIFRAGILLSLAGIFSALGGIWRTNSLRWHAPISALGTLAFWIMSASME